MRITAANVCPRCRASQTSVHRGSPAGSTGPIGSIDYIDKQPPDKLHPMPTHPTQSPTALSAARDFAMRVEAQWPMRGAMLFDS